MRKIAVFCGAAEGESVRYSAAAQQLGQYLANHQIGLVYGGGKYGLMCQIATAVLNSGGYVEGIIPQNLADRGASYTAISHLEVVENMTVRKQRMMELADGFIALPGGPGTLEEIAEVYSWSLIGENAKPCVLYNVAHYYDALQEFYDHMVKNGFLAKPAREKLFFSDSLNEIFQFITNYNPPAIRRY
ncbi:TIGR00730 family Rossman fold protein [Pediococcus acidilactici]